MSVCENCNKDHDVEAREHFPEMLRLDRESNRYVELPDEDHEDLYARIAWANKIVNSTLENYFHEAQQEGMSPKETIEKYATSMIVLGHYVGVRTHDDYERFGLSERVSDEEADEKYEEAQRILRERMEESPFMRFIAELKARAEQETEGEVSIMMINPETGETKSVEDFRREIEDEHPTPRLSVVRDEKEDDRTPGFYL